MTNSKRHDQCEDIIPRSFQDCEEVCLSAEFLATDAWKLFIQTFTKQTVNINDIFRDHP